MVFGDVKTVIPGGVGGSEELEPLAELFAQRYLMIAVDMVE